MEASGQTASLLEFLFMCRVVWKGIRHTECVLRIYVFVTDSSGLRRAASVILIVIIKNIQKMPGALEAELCRLRAA
jgi:hypothetical protein